MKPANLYIQTAFLGDLLLAIPALKRMREWEGESVLVARKGIGQLLKAMKIVDELIEVDKSSALSRHELKERLRDRQFDRVICPHQSFSSALLSYCSRARLKIGYRKPWNFFAFHKRTQRDLKLPEALRQLQLFAIEDESLRKQIAEYDGRSVPQWASMTCRSFWDRAFAGDFNDSEVTNAVAVVQSRLSQEGVQGEFALVAPGSVWGTKRWTRYRELVERLSRDVPVVLTGSPAEYDLCEETRASRPGVFNFAGMSILESSCLMYRANHLITNDCGAMHLASVVGLPTVSIFGPTVPSFGYWPWQARARVVDTGELKCRPCSPHGPMKCPIGTHECMNNVSVERVLRERDQL